jgi:hypothetical protein
MPDPEDFTAQLGRISGKLLSANLQRNGVDLTFRNNPNDDDLLYLQVETSRIGINTETPALAEGETGIDVNNFILTNDLISDQATIDNIVFEPTARITTVTGEINIRPSSPDPTAIFNRLQAGNVAFNENFIENVSNNQNLVFSPNGVGTIELESNSDLQGDLLVLGSILLDGDLSTTSNITIGDDPADVVIIGTSLSQDINPGINLTYNLGSVLKRWKEAHIPDWTKITNILPQSAVVNNTMLLGGVNNSISTITNNADLLISPDTGKSIFDNILIQDNEFVNLLNTPLSLSAVGIGYYRFQGTNGIVIPAGTIAERPNLPEVGDTRWNTEIGYLECFDGSVYITSIGPGDTVEVNDMEDLGNIYAIILG